MKRAILGFLVLAFYSAAMTNGFIDEVREKTITATKPADNNCLLMLANSTSDAAKCDFFKCFEERFPCGQKFWILNWGLKYCRRYAEPNYIQNFTESGKTLIRHVNQCLPKSLEKFYKTKKTLKCKRLMHEAFEAQGKCYAEVKDLFCKAFPENKHAFIKVLDKSDLLNYDSMMMIKKTADKCVPKIDFVQLMMGSGGKSG